MPTRPCVFVLCTLTCGLVSSAADLTHPHDFKPAFADRAAWEKRAEFLRRQALVSQGLWPLPPKTPLNPVIHGKIDRGEYTIENVFFASLPGHYVSGNLYRPKNHNGKLPVVLCPYGHWPEGRFIWKSDSDVQKEIESGAEKSVEAARSPLQANCAMLARMGCIVFQYDMVGYADSQKIAHRAGFDDIEATLRLQSFMGLQTWNSIRALDFVTGLPEVDPDRIAVAGSSGGGTQTIALGAVDPRPAVAFPMVMISMNMQGGCVCENAPLYRVLTNNVELACLFAPKPEGAAAANDWTKDFMTRGLPEMKSIWRLYGAEDRVDGVHVNYGHNHNLHSRSAQYNFLNTHLKLGAPAPIEETPFDPVPPKELSVYDEQHPLAADATDAAGVRAWMTRTSDEQLSKLSRADYVRTLRIALEAMVVDEMPGTPDIVTDNGLLTRRGAGERVLFKSIVPQNFSGEVVVWAHPDGCRSVVDDSAAVQKLLAAGRAIIAIDQFHSDAAPTTKPTYLGLTLGYNRSTVATRVHNLLSAIALAEGLKGARSVELIGIGETGPAALLARALAGDVVNRAAIDLQQFDFHLVRDESHPMLLPGAVKYGGIYGFVPLCDSGSTLLCNARETGRLDRAKKTANVIIRTEPRDAAAMVDWLLERH